MANSIQWSERERHDLLAAWQMSGLSMAAFAADAAVPRSTFSAWTRRGAHAAIAAKPATCSAAQPQFVAVELAAEESSHIEVRIGHAVIRVAADFDDAHLVRVVRALSAC